MPQTVNVDVRWWQFNDHQTVVLIIINPSLLLHVSHLSSSVMNSHYKPTPTPAQLWKYPNYCTHYTHIHFKWNWYFCIFLYPSPTYFFLLSSSPCVIFSCVYISISAAVICFRLTVFNGAAFPFHRGHMWWWDVEEDRGEVWMGCSEYKREAVQREW